MRNLSIVTKLNLLFLFGFFIITITAYLIYSRVDYRENYLTKMRFDKASQMIRDAYQKKKAPPLNELKLMDLEIVVDPSHIKKSEQKKIISVPVPSFYLGVFNTKKGKEFAIKQESKNIILKDIRIEEKTKQILIAGYFFAFFLLALFYISIYRSIHPIKDLEKKVKEFGRGNFTIDCSTTREDEIGHLANSFHSSIQKIKDLMNTRMVFLRNAAHELKTPLTKGMIALELPNSPKKEATLKGVFQRLNTLIAELLDIEKITSGNVQPVLKEYALKDIIGNVETLLLVDKGTIKHDIDDEKITVDYQLFSLAIKNLIDNGIKYSSNNETSIRIKENCLYVVNKGEPLKNPLEHYLEPFAKENENQSGFGLGLFIVNHILLLHNISLQYRYEQGYSSFFFDLKSLQLKATHCFK